MKTRFAIVATAFLITAAADSAFSQGGAETVVGAMGLENILDLQGWFGEDFRAFKPSPAVLEALASEARGVDVLILLGTWCDDSRREVPRMLTLLQTIGLTPERITMIGVDRDKKSPGGEAALHALEYVPTFIIRRDGIETGRIVEKPAVSLERDLLAILRGEPTVPLAPQQSPPPPPHSHDPHFPHDGHPQHSADGVEGEIRTEEAPAGAQQQPQIRTR